MLLEKSVGPFIQKDLTDCGVYKVTVRMLEGWGKFLIGVICCLELATDSSKIGYKTDTPLAYLA